MTYSLTLREGKGSLLTIQEMDNNFLYLDNKSSGGGGSVSNTTVTATYSLTSTQLRTLHSNPVQILSAPSNGFIQVISIIENLFYTNGDKYYDYPGGKGTTIYYYNNLSVNTSFAYGFDLTKNSYDPGVNLSYGTINDKNPLLSANNGIMMGVEAFGDASQGDYLIKGYITYSVLQLF